MGEKEGKFYAWFGMIPDPVTISLATYVWDRDTAKRIRRSWGKPGKQKQIRWEER